MATQLKYVRIRNSIYDRISKGKLRPGDRLPTETELAERFGVAPMTVRQSLDGLIHEGVIVRQRGRGTFVSERGACGLQVVELSFGMWTNPFDDPLMQHLCGGIVEGCQEASIDLLVHNAAQQEHIGSADYVANLIARRTRGILFVARVNPKIAGALPAGIQAVAVDVADPPRDMSAVHSDYVEAGRIATAHLIELRHRRVAFAGGTFSGVRREIFSGYQKALEEAGIDYDERLASVGHDGVPAEHRFPEGGFWFDKRILSRKGRPTAIVAASRSYGRNVVQFAERMGLTIPRDLALVVVGDISESYMARPTFTTVKTASRRMGRAAVRLLRELAEARVKGPVSKTIRPELEIRESCGSEST